MPDASPTLAAFLSPSPNRVVFVISAQAVSDVIAANQGFYDAFEERDMDRMSSAWEHSDRVRCTHPGWKMLRGWSEVSASWYALLGNAENLQFILTEVEAEVEGDMAWVTLEENLLAGGLGTGGTVVALNVFVRSPADGLWRLVVHHGAPLMRS